MNEKKNGMSIRKKLMLSYFSIVALIVIIGIIGIYNIHVVYNNGNEIYVNNLKSVEYLKSINQNVKETDQCIISMLSELDMNHHDEYVEKISKLQKDNQDLMAQYAQLDITELEKSRYNQCRISILTFDKQINGIVQSLETGDVDGAIGAYEQELTPAKACTYELIEAAVELSTANAQNKNEENRLIHNNLIWLVGSVMVLSILIAIIITIRMSDYFMSKLSLIQRLAKRISEYNISDDIQEMSNDEFGTTIEALNDSQFMMRDLLEKIIEQSAFISDTGEEVSIAVRKSGQRIENVNVSVLQSGEMTAQVDRSIKQILENRTLDVEIVRQLREILDKSDEARDILVDVRSELSSVAMYLEQIGIISDYQNEIANSHKEQIKKFTI